ncbi:MAG: glycosyltransferase family 10 domain-containing protein [Candidatus Hodarchaeales archaeon]|jgi:hypothetical protein
MKKIVVLNNFGDNRVDWIKRISKQSPSNNRWKDFQLTPHIEEADYVVILDGAGHISKKEFKEFINKKKIFIQREPEQVQGQLRVVKSKFDKYIDDDTHPPYVDWWLDYDYDHLSSLKFEDVNKTQNNPICIITAKSFTEGQAKRLRFLKKIQNKIDIDFYGKQDISNIFQNYKGVPEYHNTSRRDKSRLFEYEVSISLENGSRKNFFTRTSEDLLCWTLPVYWGCPNLEDFLPENSYRYVDIDSEFDKGQLEYLTRKPEKHEIKAMAEARDLVLNKYNFFPYMDKVLKEIE